MTGPHGHGSLTEAGKELLSFLSINDAAVCNTWFEKKAIHKQTWQHPKSKQWYCIDYAIMRRAHCRKCLDVAVMRGAEYNTDHMMVKVRLQFGKKVFRSGCAKIGERKFDVSKLKGRCRDERRRETTKGRFVSGVFERMRGMTGLWRRSAMKTALRETAGSVLGSEGRWQPDWFRESEDALRPLFEERKRLHTMWLSTGQQRVRKKWLGARRAARKAMRRAKNAWFERKAAAAQKGRNKGKVVWRCIRDTQRGRRGLVPMRTAVVRDEDGAVCDTSDLQQQRWRRHF